MYVSCGEIVSDYMFKDVIYQRDVFSNFVQWFLLRYIIRFYVHIARHEL